MNNHIKRCPQCQEWTDGDKAKCTFCGFDLEKKDKEEVKVRASKGDHTVPILQVNPDDPVWLKIAKRPVQVVQLILYAIIAFLVYLTTAFAH